MARPRTPTEAAVKAFCRKQLEDAMARSQANDPEWVDPRPRHQRRHPDRDALNFADGLGDRADENSAWCFVVWERAWAGWLAWLATLAAVAAGPLPEPPPTTWLEDEPEPLESVELLAVLPDRAPPAARSGWSAAVTIKAA